MEPPECPVCLQPFSEEGTVPRVLSCGHSTCEDCLSQLSSISSPFPDSIRCPSCTQLARLSRSLGPSSLPKNIDLLRLFPSSSTPPLYKHPKPLPPPTPHPLLPIWSPFVLPPIPAPTSHRLHPIASPPPSSDVDFRPIYLERVARELDRMGEADRRVLRSILRIPRVSGLWMDKGDGVLYLVVRRVAVELHDVVERSGGGVVGVGMVGTEMCEAVARLHGEGVVCGFFGLECFGFDEWGHCVIDPGRILSGRREIDGVREGHRSGPLFVSPEVIGLLEVKAKSSIGDDDTCWEVGFGSDVWSLAGLLSMIVVRWLGCRCDEEEEGIVSSVGLGGAWMEKMMSALEGSPESARFESLMRVLELCLNHDVGRRPSVRELWRCMRELVVDAGGDPLACVDFGMSASKMSPSCCLLLCGVSSGLVLGEKATQCHEEYDDLGADSAISDQLQRNGTDSEVVQKVQENGDLTNVRQVGRDTDKTFLDGALKSVTLSGHRDCITGLAIGGRRRSLAVLYDRIMRKR